jgi:hypothetical protein
VLVQSRLHDLALQHRQLIETSPHAAAVWGEALAASQERAAAGAAASAAALSRLAGCDLRRAGSAGSGVSALGPGGCAATPGGSPGSLTSMAAVLLPSLLARGGASRSNSIGSASSTGAGAPPPHLPALRMRFAAHTHSPDARGVAPLAGQRRAGRGGPAATLGPRGSGDLDGGASGSGSFVSAQQPGTPPAPGEGAAALARAPSCVSLATDEGCSLSRRGSGAAPSAAALAAASPFAAPAASSPPGGRGAQAAAELDLGADGKVRGVSWRAPPARTPPTGAPRSPWRRGGARPEAAAAIPNTVPVTLRPTHHPSGPRSRPSRR